MKLRYANIDSLGCPGTRRRRPVVPSYFQSIGYWPGLKLVVEFYERQHSEPVPFFDKPDRVTVSGVPRGQQRAIYDERRRERIPQQGIALVIISSTSLRAAAERSCATHSGTVLS